MILKEERDGLKRALSRRNRPLYVSTRWAGLGNWVRGIGGCYGDGTTDM